jgi:hypothetical protein
MPSILEAVKHWFSEDRKERRRAERRSAATLAAYFWTGGAPAPHQIRDISHTGLYLVTEERWYPGTLVMMTLQTRDPKDPTSFRTLEIQCRAVRWGEDGVGLQFVFLGAPGGRGAGKKELDKFLESFSADLGEAYVKNVGTTTT